MDREKVKTIILTVLVVLSIFLTQKIWLVSSISGMQTEAINTEINQKKILEIRDALLKPSKISVNLGAHYVNPAYNDDIWNLSRRVVKNYFIGDPDVSPSTYEEYEQQRGVKSIEIFFGKNIPSVLISSVFGSVDNRIVRDIKEIQQILIPAVGSANVYILSNADTVYKATLEDSQGELIDEVFQYIEKQSYNRFYSLFSDLGNPVLMPLSFNNTLPQIFIESKIDVTNDEAVVEHAKTFFDRNFDFIKTIKETSGSVLFIYGYGEKSVRINNRGRLEYSEDVGNTASTNVISALDVAIDFVLKHGEFPEGTYIKEINSVEKNKGYSFGFAYRINDRPLHFTDHNIVNPIEIEVYGEKVKNYKSFIRKEMELPYVEINKTMLLPHNIIDNNFQMLKEDYFYNLESESNEDDMLLKDIKSVNLVYLDNLEITRMQLITPSWEIILKDKAYYFDAYDGELIYKTLTN